MRSFFQIPHVDAGAQALALLSTASQAQYQGAGSQMEQPELEMALIWDASICRRRISQMSCPRNL